MKKVLLIILGLVLAACASKSTSSTAPSHSSAGMKASPRPYTVTSTDLINQRYILKTFNGDQVKTVNFSRIPGIEFDEDMKIHGSICNVYNGTARVEDNKLYAHAASTMMFCVEDILNNAERAFFKAMSEGADITLNDQYLTLSHDGNTFVFEHDAFNSDFI